MKMKWIFLILSVISSQVFAQKTSESHQYGTCLSHPDIQVSRSNELESLLRNDQSDRENWENLSSQELEAVTERDLKRRMRVGEIFAEGCLKTAEDYAAAAMIYQHGDVPDHYFQSFIWSFRGVTLGDEELKHMMAMAIDRYLVSIGKRQLFGSQGFISEDTGWCYCMEPVESTFPESMRQQYLGRSLSESYALIASLNEGKDNCNTLDCASVLAPTPNGTVPGFW